MLIENAIALSAVGAERIVSNELKKLKLEVREGGFGQVKFHADLPGLYRALIGLRAADRILLETASFEARDFDALFEGTQTVPWEDLIPKEMGLKVVKVRTNRSTLAAETSVQAIVHKAAAERLCQKRRFTRLPEHVDAAELRVHIEKDRVSLQLDLSGEPLFRRGYRTRGGAAPLRETTAAAIILHSLWKRKYPLYDPFCGAGTIAAEAAMYAWDIAPGLGRQFTLSRLLPADAKLENEIREDFFAKIDFSRLVRIAGSDSDASAIAASLANMERALSIQGKRKQSGAPPHISLPIFKVLPMDEAVIPPEFGLSGANADNENAPGYIITNPPYGRRLGNAESAEKTYTEMGELIPNFPGWKLAVITDHEGFESFFGRKADSCREITNGAIRSYLYQYENL